MNLFLYILGQVSLFTAGIVAFLLGLGFFSALPDKDKAGLLEFIIALLGLACCAVGASLCLYPIVNLFQ
ncbi:hypothetical protein [Hymenobacter mucosus]|uniref:Uncharacterized protein n=1 Tax=Hymenobacter mucosus TaxID=1411120 RepID=A0A239A9H5_9BACT|nr:hypothetical protein [Hymenobacter mucosus]SNR92159.1 hypothetical protein SAMN06269173_11180 [Hymenobacter mucosus]